jgi:hypothetical protein
MATAALSPSSSLYSVEKLSEKNYSAWKFRVQLVLQDRGLWKYVEGAKADPPSDLKLRESWEEKDQQARAQILLTVSDTLLPAVRHTRTAKEAWVKVASVFEQKGLSAQVFLRRKLVNLRFEEGESMQTHLNTIRDIVDELAGINVIIKDEELAIITLCSLPSRFDSLIVSMESRPANEITFDYVSNRLLGEYHRQSELSESSSSSSSESSALLARQFKSSKCVHCGRPGHTVQKCWDKYPEQRPARQNNYAVTNFDDEPNTF